VQERSFRRVISLEKNIYCFSLGRSDIVRCYSNAAFPVLRLYIVSINFQSGAELRASDWRPGGLLKLKHDRGRTADLRRSSRNQRGASPFSRLSRGGEGPIRIDRPPILTSWPSGPEESAVKALPMFLSLSLIESLPLLAWRGSNDSSPLSFLPDVQRLTPAPCSRRL